MNPYLTSFFQAWSFTIVVETIIILGIFKAFLKRLVETKYLILVGIFANALTLPYVWFIFPSVFIGQYWFSLVFSEFFALLTEAIFYKVFLKITIKQALLVSFIANFSSFVLGYLFGHYL